MQSLFVGLVFVFLDFSLQLGRVRIDLVPDFVGYLLICRGLRQMAPEGARFGRTIPAARCAAVYTGLLYFLNLTGLPARAGAQAGILPVAATAASLLVSYGITRAVEELELRLDCDFGASGLRMAWIALTAASMLHYLLLRSEVLGNLSMLCSMAAGIVYLAAFYRSRERYLGGA